MRRTFYPAIKDKILFQHSNRWILKYDEILFQIQGEHVASIINLFLDFWKLIAYFSKLEIALGACKGPYIKILQYLYFLKKKKKKKPEVNSCKFFLILKVFNIYFYFSSLRCANFTLCDSARRGRLRNVRTVQENSRVTNRTMAVRGFSVATTNVRTQTPSLERAHVLRALRNSLIMRTCVGITHLSLYAQLYTMRWCAPAFTATNAVLSNPSRLVISSAQPRRLTARKKKKKNTDCHRGEIIVGFKSSRSWWRYYCYYRTRTVKFELNRQQNSLCSRINFFQAIKLTCIMTRDARNVERRRKIFKNFWNNNK